MLSINKVMVTGRLTRDPETKYLPSGTAITNLGIAVNRRYLDKNSNEWKDETTFLDVETWGKLAERCAETLKKGRPVYIEGRLRTDTWEKEGQKQSKIRLVAERVTGFDVPSRGDSGDTSADAGDAEGYGGGTGGPATGGVRRAAGPSRAAAPTGTPSDQLDFDPGPDASVQDDIPF